MEIFVPFSSYKYLRLIAVLAGLLGAVQSVTWMGMSITAVVSYYCNIGFGGVNANFGTALQLTLFQMYFRGQCEPDGFPQISFNAIADLDLMTSQTVHFWMWVVMMLSLLWLFSSLMLLNVKKTNIKYLNVFLYIWICITFIICIIDLVLFIFFTIDYDTIVRHSYTIPLNFAAPTQSILITAQNSAGMMMALSLRGYFLWIINLTLCVYLFTQTFKVYDHNKLTAHRQAVNKGHTNNGFKNDELQGHSIYNNQPINAYEMQQNNQHPWYNYLTTDIPRVNRPQSHYPPPLVRSTSVGRGLDENFLRRSQGNGSIDQIRKSMNEDVVLRGREQSNVVRELKDRQSHNTNYTPVFVQGQRDFDSRPQLKSAMRNSRY